MDKKMLEEKVRALLLNPADSQEFTALFSLDEHWEKINKKQLTIPRSTALAEEECPECEQTLRIIFRKFNPHLTFFAVTCPHCNKKVGVESEYAGYTAEILVEEYDKSRHKDQ